MEMMSNRYEHYLKPRPSYVWLSWLMLISSFCICLWSGMVLYRQYQQLIRQEALTAAVRVASHRPPPKKPTRADLERDRNWSVLRGELAFSWYPIFSSLEHATNPNIALLEFVPDKAAGRLTLKGSAHDMNALTDYLASLSSEAAFHDVYLAHQKIGLQNNVQVIFFEIRMQL